MKIEEIWRQYYSRVSHKPSGIVRKYYWVPLSKFFGTLDHISLTEELCQEYVNLRTRTVKHGTVWGELGALKTAMNWAVRKRLIEPYTWDIRLPRPSPPRERRLTREELQRLLDHTFDNHVRLFIILLISTAARTNAILDLTWDRVDFDMGLIDLRKPVEGNHNSKGRAVVPMTKSLRTALLGAKSKARTQYVIEYAGQRIHRAWYSFKRAARAAGLEWCTPHHLRHTAASWMVESGVPIQEVAKVLGHTNSRITERVYAKYSPDYLRKAVSALEMEI